VKKTRVEGRIDPQRGTSEDDSSRGSSKENPEGHVMTLSRQTRSPVREDTP
jgi:hypothetical protein